MKTKSRSRIALPAALLLVLAVAWPADAQRRPADAGERIERRLEALDRHLKLTEAQEVEIRRLLTEHARRMQALAEEIRNDPNASREAARERFQALANELNRALQAILTPEQLARYRQQRGRVRPDEDGRRGRGGLGGALRELELTAAQQAQLRAALDAQREKTRAWRESHPNATRDERRAFAAALAEELRAAIEAILTPEQAAAFRAWKAEQRERHGEHRPEAPGARSGQAATGYGLEGNYPNPFNPTTEIRFTLPDAVHARLVVYDVAGREVARLVDRPLDAGPHAVTFDAAGLPSGVYVYRLTAGALDQSGRMVLMK